MATDSGSERSSTPENDMSNSHSELSMTLRFIANSKEAGGIIGKGGENVKRFREESGARINISDSSSSERIVAIIGTASQIKIALRLIGEKFEEDLQNAGQDGGHISFRFIIPNSNCGSIIGKSGANIKELRELSGASIQVANEMLPNSTERTVTVSGTVDSVMKTLDKILTVSIETKPRGPVIPYQPMRGGYGAQAGRGGGGGGQGATGGYGGGYNYGGAYNQTNGRQGGGRYGGMMGDGPARFGGMHAAYPNDYADDMGLVDNGSYQTGGSSEARTQTKEMTIANEMVGSIIGRQGSRINEIRQQSRAQVKISDAEEGSTDRRVIVTGSPAAVSSALFQISNLCARYKSSKE